MWFVEISRGEGDILKNIANFIHFKIPIIETLLSFIIILACKVTREKE